MWTREPTPAPLRTCKEPDQCPQWLQCFPKSNRRNHESVKLDDITGSREQEGGDLIPVIYKPIIMIKHSSSSSCCYHSHTMQCYNVNRIFAV